MWKTIFSNILSSKKPMVIFLLPALILLLGVAVSAYISKIPISQFTRDPLAITKGQPYFGLISNAGVMLWSFSCAISLFSYLVIKDKVESKKILNAIILGGLISSILLLDDLFMLHEIFYPIFFGLKEKVILMIYGAIFIYYLVKHKNLIIENNVAFIILTMMFWGLSILVDSIPKTRIPWHHLFEDGFKFLGVVCWFGAQFLMCYKETKKCLKI